MELEIQQLDEQINLGRQYEKCWIGNWLKLGKILTEIHRLYKTKYNTFEECIEENFSFDRSYAYKFMKIYEKYGDDVERFHKLKQYGIKFLITTCYVKDEHVDMIIKKISPEKKLNKEELQKEINRMKDQAGTIPYYSDDPEEHKLKLIRQGQDIITHIEAYLESYSSLKEGLLSEIGAWKSACRKYPSHEELINLRKEIEEKSKTLG